MLMISFEKQQRTALQIPAVIKPQMTDVGPPLGSARLRDADRAVQEFKMAKASPSIARGLKWRLSSALWPIDSYKIVCSAFILGSGKFGSSLARLKVYSSCNLFLGISNRRQRR